MHPPAFSPRVHHHHHHHRPRQWEQCWARLLAPLTIWICVSVSLKYGYYGDCHMVLGPSSSRLFEANTLLVKQVQVRDDESKGVFLYGFSEMPELSLEANWSVSKYVVVPPFSGKGFYLWMNKGSRIWIGWEVQTSSFDQLQVSLIKGERVYETLQPVIVSSSHTHGLIEPTEGKEAEYSILEDDRYYIGIMNTNPTSILMVLNLNVSSKMYDTKKAKSMCSTVNGSCRINLLRPKIHYFVVNTPNNGDIRAWFVELSFLSRIVTYIAILGFVVIIIFLVLKTLGTCSGESYVEELPVVRDVSEAHPLMPGKTFQLLYGTGEVDRESGTSSSSEDLYDGKICVICYDMLRNCFFVPCGHFATCYDCAKRIMDGECKACPICRRLIYKVRKLIVP